MSESLPNSPHRQIIKLLTETWEDDDLSSSGSLVQMTIMAHNAGYNDKPYLKKVKNPIYCHHTNYRKQHSDDIDGILFYGNNIKCGKEVDPILEPVGKMWWCFIESDAALRI